MNNFQRMVVSLPLKTFIYAYRSINSDLKMQKLKVQEISVSNKCQNVTLITSLPKFRNHFSHRWLPSIQF